MADGSLRKRVEETFRRTSRDSFRSPSEFARQLHWRLLLVSAFMALDLFFILVGGGTSSLTVLAAYLPYLALVTTLHLLCSHRRALSESVALMVVAFAADFLFIAAQLHLSGGGWWHGASLYILAIVIAASTVPPRTLAIVTALGVAIYVGKGWLEVSGVWVPPVWGVFPRVDGNVPFLWNYAAFGALAIIGAALMQLRMVQRIRHAQQRLRTVVDASPYLVLTLDRQDVIITVSRASHRITGHEPEQLTGRPIASLVVPSELQALQELLHAVRRGERLRREFRGVAASGIERWYGMGFSRIENEQEIDDVVVMVRDMTDERRQADERAQLARELEEARRLELVGRLVSGVAHELNNPLSSILALAEQLEQERDAHGVAEEARIIHEQARRARAIVRDLLQVVRVSSVVTRESEDVRASVTQALDALRSHPLARRVRLHTRVPDTPLLVTAEEGCLGQVLTNLIVNAMQATDEESQVEIDVVGEPVWVRIEVRDNGHGFDDDTSARLFEPFFTTRAPGQGTGLGLAVSRAIVERHGGTLHAESLAAPDRGAKFTVRLPRASAPVTGAVAMETSAGAPPASDAARDGHPQTAAPPEVPTPAMSVAHEFAPRRVFIIDDESSIRIALRRWFTRNGWLVDECADGAIAIERLLADGTAFTAILCDLKMPGTSGMEVYARLLDDAPELLDRLIITTGDVASADVAAFLEGVAVPVLEKPFGLAQLARLLELRTAAVVSR